MQGHTHGSPPPTVGPARNNASPTPPVRPGRRARHREEIRERLLQAGHYLLRTKGFRSTTIRDITERADVGHGTFYNYFLSKGDLFLAIADWSEDDFRLVEQRVRAGDQTVQDALEEHGRRRWQWTPTLFLSCIAVIMESAGLRARFRQILDANRRKVERLLAIGQQRGEIRSDLHAQEVARFLQYGGYGALMIESFQATAASSDWLDKDRGPFARTYWGTVWGMILKARMPGRGGA